ncbi:MAG: amidohydrolase family protein [Sphingomonas sp.]
MLRIATEEAYSIPEISEALTRASRIDRPSLDMTLLRVVYGSEQDDITRTILANLLDIDRRLADMDANGVDMHVLSLTAPGVQMFEADEAAELAALANDRMAEVVRAHPTRFAGLASFAPQDPDRAAQEIERARGTLGLHGLVVNSHTNDEYLDDPKFSPILEAAEATDSALYIHPRAPSAHLAGACSSYGMSSALWGYGLEVSTHAVRLMASGVFDRFPKLKIVLGHMGEGVHFWLWRMDYMHAAGAAAGRAGMRRLELTPSEYFKRNFVITTSGQENPHALDYSLKMLGEDNVLWAIDFPYQPTAPAVKFMDDAPLDPAVKAKVYGGNAQRVFHIDPR